MKDRFAEETTTGTPYRPRATMTDTHIVSPELFHVQVRTRTAQLWRLSTGEFQVLRPGEFASLLGADGAILAVKPLAEALHADCGNDIELKPATIIRRATAESWSSYMELVIATELRIPSDLPSAAQSMRRAWRGAGLIVRGDVRDSLLALGLSDLVFSSDFDMFQEFYGIPKTAAVAVARQLPLVTRNRRDFEAFAKVSGARLSLLDWTKPARSGAVSR
jgi:hypothetical protein